ncbi:MULTISPECIES: DNA-3-methyladenine glycosylase [Bacillota]|uniref:DNA-3-methyladenine glycosylase n=1 Tax=Bacillota TaxID=1239 RepID=UPI00065BD67B|nr:MULTISPECIES: DNA-3-methyladenine glycosylase [Bacillota]MBO1219819.1 DNA-3-methyladenine glycosylase [Mammaliicoccus sciuri]MBO1232236.1 DNA-3-methyladenine glycosylase [Mammaliicoccus sciuri]MDQ7130808.1 DNA-3-methyladenine glycosylase [Mammaliicoccus sciuri]PNY97455.1 3-methyladenine DNA glycosylase [Mammaliicoccus sciuri]PTJ80846.1 3-methyladenine DNA glycosylase [Mammaliicoccus sciuri]
MDFINRTTEEIAADLLGVKIIHETEDIVYTGYIVETEAYIGKHDQAAHSFNGRNTKSVKSLYCEGGTIYAHSMHKQLLINFVTQVEGEPQGVLIRAIEPEHGTEQMALNRNGKTGIELTNGPGKFTQAMQISKTLDGTKLNANCLKIDTTNRRYPKQIERSARIGIPNKGIWTDKPLRFTVAGHPYVSKARKRDSLPCAETWK